LASCVISSDDGRQHGLGLVGQRGGEEQQHQQHDPGGDEQRELRAPAGTVDHLRLGRASIDDEGAGETGTDVGQRETVQIGGLTEALIVTGGIGARGSDALGQDDHEHGKDGRYQGAEESPTPVHLRQPDVRPPARHGAQHAQLLAQVEVSA
jgi:hypothetical protein